MKREKERRLESISSSSLHFFFSKKKTKCNEKKVMPHILFDTMLNWMKYQNEKKDIRTVRKVTNH
jgi:hypothetical protein